MTDQQRKVVIRIVVATNASSILAITLGGWRGIAGLVLGLASTSINLLAWKAILSLLSHSEIRNTPRHGALMIVFAFFTKLPLFVGCVVLVYHLGGAAPASFLVGLALVYSAFIGWVLAQR